MKMKAQAKYIAIFLMLILGLEGTYPDQIEQSSKEDTSENQSEISEIIEPIGPANLYATTMALDFLLPGYGMLRKKKYVASSAIAFGRIGSAIAAASFYNRYLNYKSATRAATVAEFYYGPGISYYDPYSKTYRRRESFEREAGVSRYYYGLSITAHILIAVASLYLTDRSLADESEKNIPQFDLPDGNRLPGENAEIENEKVTPAHNVHNLVDLPLYAQIPLSRMHNSDYSEGGPQDFFLFEITLLDF